MSETYRGLALSAKYVAEDELHAYVDGQLPPGRKSSVESYLSNTPGEQNRLQAYRHQNIELHRLFDPSPESELSEECERLAAKLNVALARQRMTRWAVRGATALGLAAATVAASWSGIDNYLHPEPPMAVFARQATEAHMMAVGKAKSTMPLASPAAVRDGPPPAVVGIPVPTPDLAKIGFSLAGGRILPTSRGPAVQLLYANDDGGRVTLFVGMGAPASRASFTILDESGMTLIYWQIGALGYSLIGNVDRTKLLALAESVIESLSHGATSGKPAVAAPPPANPAVERAPDPPMRKAEDSPPVRKAVSAAAEPIGAADVAAARPVPAARVSAAGETRSVAPSAGGSRAPAPSHPADATLRTIKLKPPT